jgi:DNA-directed RNA polymerase specialized sigma24 family protein
VAKNRPTNFDTDLAKLVDFFVSDNPASFYLLLMNSCVLHTVTQTENLWNRVGEEGEVQSVVYLHFLKNWQRIRTLALSGGGAVAGYLVETIRNAVRDSLRKQERRQKRERSLVSGLHDRGNEAEAVEDQSGSVLDHVIAREQTAQLHALKSDPEEVRFGAIYKLKMMMRCATDQLDQYQLTPEESAWRPDLADHPSARPAGRVAGWVGRLRRWDEAGNRFKPTSRKLARMLGMVGRHAPEALLKDKANVFDQWFRRAKIKLAARLKE